MIPLKTTLLVNALSSGLTGVGLVIFAPVIASLFEVNAIPAFIGVGAFLILFSLYVLAAALRRQTDAGAVNIIIALDISWVIASVILVAFTLNSLSLTGTAIIIAVAAWVGAMAYLQIKGLKQENATIVH